MPTLEGSTIFLYRSSLGRTSMESCRLAELNYAIFSGTGRKTKKLRLLITPARRPSEVGMSKIGYFFWHFMLLGLLLLSLNKVKNYALFVGKCQKY